MTRQKNKRRDTKKWYQNNSPETADRGETSDIPQPPFGRNEPGRQKLNNYGGYKS